MQTNTGGDVILFDVNSWNPVPRVLSAQDCCAACRDTPECNVWTYCPRREGCSNDCPEYIGRYVTLPLSVEPRHHGAQLPGLSLQMRSAMAEAYTTA